MRAWTPVLVRPLGKKREGSWVEGPRLGGSFAGKPGAASGSPQPQGPVRSPAARRGPACLRSCWARPRGAAARDHVPVVESWEARLRGGRTDVLDGSSTCRNSDRALHVCHLLLLGSRRTHTVIQDGLLEGSPVAFYLGLR